MSNVDTLMDALISALAETTAETMKSGGAAGGASAPPAASPPASAPAAKPSLFANKPAPPAQSAKPVIGGNRVRAGADAPAASTAPPATSAPSAAATPPAGRPAIPKLDLSKVHKDAPAPPPQSAKPVIGGNRSRSGADAPAASATPPVAAPPAGRPAIPKLDLSKVQKDDPAPGRARSGAVSGGQPPADQKMAGLWEPAKEDKKEARVTGQFKSKDGRTTASATAGASVSKQEYDRTEGSNVERGGKLSADTSATAKIESTVGDKDGAHATGSGKAKVAGGASLEGKAGGGTTKGIDGKTLGLYGELSAEAKAKLEAQAKAEGKLAYGDFATFAATAEGRAWIEARATFAASGSIGTDGVAAKVDAYAGVAAGAMVKVEAEVQVGDLGLSGAALAEFRAAVEAGASGTFNLDGGGITVGGEAFVFAGVEVKAEGEVTSKLYSRPVLTLRGNAGGHVGYKFGGGGLFQMRGGKLIVSFDVAASVALPAGATLGSGVEFDAKPVAVALARGLSDLTWSIFEDDANKALTDVAGSKAKLVEKLQGYSDFKRKQLATKKSENYVKIEKIQMYVKQCFPVQRLDDDKNPMVADVNRAIKEAILETIVAKPGKTLEVTVSRGRVKDIKNMAGPKGSKDEVDALFSVGREGIKLENPFG